MHTFNIYQESPKKQIPQLNHHQGKSDKLWHNESSDMDQIITCRHIQSFNDHKLSFNYESQYNCKNQEWPNIAGDGGKSFVTSKFVVTAQNVKEVNDFRVF
jgi:hypothetical protein